MKNRKYSDVRKVKSELVQFRPDETAKQRHARRLEFNLKAEEWFREAVSASGLTLIVANGGHHWQIRGENFKADWWPSSAKLVFNAAFKKGIHVHDYEKALELIRAEYAKPAKKRKREKIKKHYCFHCHVTKIVSAFRSLGCTWCKQCELT